MGVRKRIAKHNSHLLNKETTINNTNIKSNNSIKNETKKNSLVLKLFSILETLKLVFIFLAILLVIWLHLQLRTTKSQLEIKTKEIIILKNKLELISKANDNINNNGSVSNNETNVEEFPELTRYIGNIKHGHNPEVTVLFASENTGDTKEQIISLAKEVLFSKDLVNCLHRKDNAEFDVYKSCFRDISIELYNSIQTKFRTDWVVTVGVVDNCFMVTDISYNHEEYFFHFDRKIYFEVFRLPGNEPKVKGINDSVTNIDGKIEQFHENVENDDQIRKERIQENQNKFEELDDEEEEIELIAETNEHKTQ